MEEVPKINWHDSEIVSVIELPDKNQLILNVEYPENWGVNKFTRKAIVFTGFYALEINEIPFWGCPTILGAEVVGSENGYFKVKLDTNAGYRLVIAQSVELLPEWQNA